MPQRRSLLVSSVIAVIAAVLGAFVVMHMATESAGPPVAAGPYDQHTESTAVIGLDSNHSPRRRTHGRWLRVVGDTTAIRLFEGRRIGDRDVGLRCTEFPVPRSGDALALGRSIDAVLLVPTREPAALAIAWKPTTANTEPEVLSVVEGHSLSGSVRDMAGHAVAGLRVELAPFGHRLIDRDNWPLLTAVTDAAGSFGFPFTMPAGDHELIVLLGDQNPVVQHASMAGDRAKHVEMRVDLANTLRGRAIDGRGRPLADAQIVARAVDPRDERQLELGRTDAEGYFRVERRPEHPDQLVLGVEYGNEVLWDESVVSWGQVCLLRVPLSSLTIVALAEDGGGPVTSFAIELASGTRDSQAAWFPRVGYQGTHALGRVAIPRGADLIGVRVVPSDDSLARSRWVDVADQDEVVVMVPAASPLEITVLSAGTLRPVANADVRVFRRGTLFDRSGARQLELDLTKYYAPPIVVGRSALVLARGTTDSRGRLDVVVPVSERAVELCVREERHAETVLPVPLADRKATVILPREAVLLARLKPLSGLPDSAGLTVSTGLAFDSVWFPKNVNGAFPNEEGRIRIGQIAAGEYNLYVRLDSVPQTPPILEHLQFGEGETKQIDLDMSAFVVGRIRVRVVVPPEESALEQPQILLFRLERRFWLCNPERSVDLVAHAVEFESLLPGRYRVVVGGERDGQYARLIAPDWLVLEPGGEIDTEVTVHRYPLRLRLRHVDGTPLRESEVLIESKCCGREAAMTDRDGRIQRPSGPDTPYLVRFGGVERSVRPVAGSESEVELVFP